MSFGSVRAVTMATAIAQEAVVRLATKSGVVLLEKSTSHHLKAVKITEIASKSIGIVKKQLNCSHFYPCPCRIKVSAAKKIP